MCLSHKIFHCLRRSAQMDTLPTMLGGMNSKERDVHTPL